MTGKCDMKINDDYDKGCEHGSKKRIKVESDNCKLYDGLYKHGCEWAKNCNSCIDNMKEFTSGCNDNL